MSTIFFASEIKPEDFLHNPSDIETKGYFRFVEERVIDCFNEERDEYNQFRKKLFKALHDKIRANEDPNFLKKFVCYCTGQSYIPTPKAFPNFRIIIEFSSIVDGGVKRTSEEWPFGHTCVKTLKLPLQAYKGDTGKFFHKLEQAMSETMGSFGMT